MKYINLDRTDSECRDYVIKTFKRRHTQDYTTARMKKEIKEIEKSPIKSIRYVDNGYRIFRARNNWNLIINAVIYRLTHNYEDDSESDSDDD